MIAIAGTFFDFHPTLYNVLAVLALYEPKAGFEH
jgi:hypothetical protein